MYTTVDCIYEQNVIIITIKVRTKKKIKRRTTVTINALYTIVQWDLRFLFCLIIKKAYLYLHTLNGHFLDRGQRTEQMTFYEPWILHVSPRPSEMCFIAVLHFFMLFIRIIKMWYIFLNAFISLSVFLLSIWNKSKRKNQTKCNNSNCFINLMKKAHFWRIKVYICGMCGYIFITINEAEWTKKNKLNCCVRLVPKVCIFSCILFHCFILDVYLQRIYVSQRVLFFIFRKLRDSCL